MDSAGDIVCKFIKWSKETKKLSKTRRYSNSKYGVPDKESDDGMLGDFAFFPSDSGMGKICNNSSDGGSNKIREPDKIVILDNEIGQNCKESIIETGN